MPKKIIKYKLVDQEGYTRKGLTGETYWLDGEKKMARGKGVELCTDDLIHYYDHPLLAVLFNPIHASIENPRLIKIEIDKEGAYDGLKGGGKKAKFTKEVKLPEITTEQIVTFAIKISLVFCRDTEYRKWAGNWINGENRGADAAWAAAKAVKAAAGAATGAAVAAINKLFIKTITNIVGKRGKK